ncbi:MAG: 2'-5' RNA ligase family protein [Gammaproteobacteria bacterium]|nr:2'-5' RNA ligase family protein [Gammaproteobacteria bacterium]
MYLWIGINVDSQLQDIKKEGMRIDKELEFTDPNFTLPMHVSLKISFDIDEKMFKKITKDIINYYNSIKPFEIDVKGIEYNETIVWIRMLDNEKIHKIHDDFNELLLKKYNIPLHEYDTDYKFHSTLFMSENKELIKKAYDLIKDKENLIPKKLLMNRFLIGYSDEGDPGTYHIHKEVVR